MMMTKFTSHLLLGMLLIGASDITEWSHETGESAACGSRAAGFQVCIRWTIFFFLVKICISPFLMK